MLLRTAYTPCLESKDSKIHWSFPCQDWSLFETKLLQSQVSCCNFASGSKILSLGFTPIITIFDFHLMPLGSHKLLDRYYLSPDYNSPESLFQHSYMQGKKLIYLASISVSLLADYSDIPRWVHIQREHFKSASISLVWLHPVLCECIGVRTDYQPVDWTPITPPVGGPPRSLHTTTNNWNSKKKSFPLLFHQ